jgi:hypothetical protein
MASGAAGWNSESIVLAGRVGQEDTRANIAKAVVNDGRKLKCWYINDKQNDCRTPVEDQEIRTQLV